MTYTEKAAQTPCEPSSPDDRRCGHERLAHCSSDGICRTCGCGLYKAASLPCGEVCTRSPEECANGCMTAAEELSREAQEMCFSGPDADLREQVRTALYKVMRSNGWDGVVTLQVSTEMAEVLDAVMAVVEPRQRDVRVKWHDMCLKFEEQFDENARLRDELTTARRNECTALCGDIESDRTEYEATIARAEAVADDYDKPGSYAVASRIREALKKEN